MNNPLIDIRQILINNNITIPIVIDGFVIDDTRSQINIQSEPSSIRSMQHHRTISFSIYSKGIDREQTILTTTKIQNILNNFFGGLDTATSVRFLMIKCVTASYFWGQAKNGDNIYMSKYEAVINDTDIKSIYL